MVDIVKKSELLLLKSKSLINIDLLLSAPLAKLDITDDIYEIIDYDKNYDNMNVYLNEHENGENNDEDDEEEEETNLLNNKNYCKSLENLVQTFDFNINKCIDDYDNYDIEIRLRGKDKMYSSQTWYTLTGSFENHSPIKRSQSQRYFKTIWNYKDFKNDNEINENESSFSDNLNDIQIKSYDENKEESDNYEINKLDNQSIITTNTDMELLSTDNTDCNNELTEYKDQEQLNQPLFTVEQVLKEIDSIIEEQHKQDTQDVEFICEYDESTPDSGYYPDLGSENHVNNSTSFAEYINTLDEIYNGFYVSRFDRTNLSIHNVLELNKLIENYKAKIKSYSEILIQELDLRDEFEFEKETKNKFISLMMSIQNKKRHMLNEDMNNKKKKRRSLDVNNIPGTHLTTIIPYNENVTLRIDHLEILNKLLIAINDDNPQVPELLTNYILKVVCPNK